MLKFDDRWNRALNLFNRLTTTRTNRVPNIFRRHRSPKTGPEGPPEPTGWGTTGPGKPPGNEKRRERSPPQATLELYKVKYFKILYSPASSPSKKPFSACFRLARRSHSDGRSCFLSEKERNERMYHVPERPFQCVFGPDHPATTAVAVPAPFSPASEEPPSEIFGGVFLIRIPVSPHVSPTLGVHPWTSE